MAERRKTVCVTGAGGFAASWLVKLLLSKGYTVHGTVRDPDDEKNGHLKRLDCTTENLQMFKADFLDYDSLFAAIAGCEGVFHTACPVPSGKLSDPEKEMISPAVDGTLNVLKACYKAEVRRVVVVSSVSAVFVNPAWPYNKVMDEECWSDKEFCKKSENWYCFSKTIAEEKALEYAGDCGLDVLTVCPALIIGPMLQPTLNSTTAYLLNILKGLHNSTKNVFLHLVDVRDVADALLLAYEKPEATGRYICWSHSVKSRDFVDKIRSMYPSLRSPNISEEVERDFVLSSDKLKQLGWQHMTPEQSVKDTVEHLVKAGFL